MTETDQRHTRLGQGGASGVAQATQPPRPSVAPATLVRAEVDELTITRVSGRAHPGPAIYFY